MKGAGAGIDTDANATARDVESALRELINPEKAEFLPRFFKTHKGGYGEGDLFLGVVVPDQRKVARRFKDLPEEEILALLDSPFHECRLTGLFILVRRYERSDPERRARITNLYVERIHRVNNWDLVDSSAHKILGPQAWETNTDLLFELADRNHLWSQRAAMVATYYFIKKGRFDMTLALAQRFLDHEHDLMHKAVGWMLREMGKQAEEPLESFLGSHYRDMPRTMLRYAIEKLPEPRRQAYLKGEI